LSIPVTEGACMGKMWMFIRIFIRIFFPGHEHQWLSVRHRSHKPPECHSTLQDSAKSIQDATETTYNNN